MDSTKSDSCFDPTKYCTGDSGEGIHHRTVFDARCGGCGLRNPSTRTDRLMSSSNPQRYTENNELDRESSLPLAIRNARAPFQPPQTSFKALQARGVGEQARNTSIIESPRTSKTMRDSITSVEVNVHLYTYNYDLSENSDDNHHLGVYQQASSFTIELQEELVVWGIFQMRILQQLRPGRACTNAVDMLRDDIEYESEDLRWGKEPVKKHSFNELIISQRGAQLVSQWSKKFCKDPKGKDHNIYIAYHPSKDIALQTYQAKPPRRLASFREEERRAKSQISSLPLAHNSLSPSPSPVLTLPSLEDCVPPTSNNKQTTAAPTIEKTSMTKRSETTTEAIDLTCSVTPSPAKSGLVRSGPVKSDLVKSGRIKSNAKSATFSDLKEEIPPPPYSRTKPNKKKISKSTKRRRASPPTEKPRSPTEMAPEPKKTRSGRAIKPTSYRD